jgi:hypothetical protein
MALVVVLLGAVAGAFYLQHVRQVERLRTGMERVHREQVTPAAGRILPFVDKLEQWTVAAATEGAPEPWADPALRFAGLHDAQGVYLRLPAEAARSRQGIRQAAREMGRDAITRCLGIEPIPLRGLYDRTDFLSPRFLDGLHLENRVMRLRVMEDQLARHVRRDVPLLLHTVRSDYFLLVLQHAERRAEGPVDVFLWDIKRDRPLLRTRVESKGILLPVRVDMGGAKGPRTKPDLKSPGAQDCSIAAEVKALTGEEPLAARRPRVADDDDEDGAEDEPAEGEPPDGADPADGDPQAAD